MAQPSDPNDGARVTQTRKTSFQDVRDAVIRRIQDQEWPQGSLLPTELELAEEFGCARATVNRALRELAERGIIDRKRKSGTRVCVAPVKQAKFEIAVTRHTVEETNAQYRYSLVDRKQLEAPEWLRARLGLGGVQPALHLRSMHYADNQPFQYEDRWIMLDTVPDAETENFEIVAPGEWLVSRVPFSDAEIVFSACAADETLGRFLGTPTGTPLFQVERTTWFQGQPVTYVRLTFQPGYSMSTRY
jgi:GntR family histidine utilization transcriptional repressor